MMRKDVKLGFAIGGVLLAVLVVYLLVGTSGDRKTVADSGAVVVTEEPSSGTSGKTPADNPPESKPGTTPPGPLNTIPPSGASGSTGLASNDKNGAAGSRDANKDLWGTALNDGKLLMTETPDASSTARTTPPSDIPGGGTPQDRTAKPVDANAKGPSTLPAHAEAPRRDTDVVTSPGAANTPADVDASNHAVPSGSSAAAALPSQTETSSSAHSVARTHVVQKNETLASIAEMAYGNRNLYPAIMRANPNLDPKKMRPGMTIVLPPVNEVRPNASSADQTSSATPASHTAGSLDSRNEYRVSSGDTLERIAMKLYGKRDMIDKIYELNKEKIGPDRDKLRLGMVLKLPEPPTAAMR